ncbi:Thymidine kinase 2 mitochondrial [Taenia crassiceps]|uniref:Thymidine kinase 2 mitochondrial n=1 Tax=Taenia crassiceps TaxID=6207 RepID=A0ABR4QAZ9_9CEST
MPFGLAVVVLGSGNGGLVETTLASESIIGFSLRLTSSRAGSLETLLRFSSGLGWQSRCGNDAPVQTNWDINEESFYDNPCRWNTPFRAQLLVTLANQHSAPRTSKVCLIERSIYSNRYVFTEVNRQNGVITDGDCEVIDEYFKWSCQLPIFKLDLIVYLRSPPEICEKRIRIRQRKGEDSMSIEFLREVHRLHEEWLLGENSKLCPAPVIIFDTSGSLDNVTAAITEGCIVNKALHATLTGLVGEVGNGAAQCVAASTKNRQVKDGQNKLESKATELGVDAWTRSCPDVETIEDALCRCSKPSRRDNEVAPSAITLPPALNHLIIVIFCSQAAVQRPFRLILLLLLHLLMLASSGHPLQL